MNFRSLASFWKKRGNKDSTGRNGRGSTTLKSNTSPEQQQENLQREQRVLLPFENTHAALMHIRHILDSRKQRGLSELGFPQSDDENIIINNNNNSMDCHNSHSTPRMATSQTTREVQTPLLCPVKISQNTKKVPLSLRQEREEMIAALELCMLEIPDEVPNVKNSKNSISGSNNSNSNNNMKEESTKGIQSIINHESENKIVVEKVITDVVQDNLVQIQVENNNNNNNKSDITFSQEEWRYLLWRIVNVLIEIDRAIYAEVMLRPSPLLIPLGNTPLLSPSKGNLIRSNASHSSLAFEGIESPSHSTFQSVLASKKGKEPGTPKISGLTDVKTKPAGLRRVEEQLSLVKAITTWTIMKIILQQQLGQHSFQNSNTGFPATEEASLILSASNTVTTEIGVGNSTVIPNQIIYAIPVLWEEVVTELMESLSITQRLTVESIISVWMISDEIGCELVQSILQKPQTGSNKIVIDKKNVAARTTPLPAAITTTTTTSPSSVGGNSSNKVIENKSILLSSSSSPFGVSPPPSNITTVIEPRVAENTCIDDLVEQVENIYEQNVVITWVTYLEQQTNVFSFESIGNQDDILPSSDICHCHMMAAYVICSPYRSEECWQQIFQLLHRLWEEDYASTTLNNNNNTNNREASPSVAITGGGWRSVGSTIDGRAGTNSAVSAIMSNTTGEAIVTTTNEYTLTEPPKLFSITQQTPERMTNVSDVENHSFRSFSVNSLPEGGGGAVITAMTWKDTICAALEEELVPFMLQIAWANALHIRVDQCLKSCTLQHLQLAQQYAFQEREVAIASFSHMCQQKALESLVKVRIAAGNCPSALKIAQIHFANAKKRWSTGKQSYISGVNYLLSMGLLTQAQVACQMDKSVVETTQFAIPQALLCEQLINDLSQIHGPYILRYIEARHAIHLAKLFLLRESWRAYHRLDNSLHTNNYFEQYIEQINFGRKSKRDLEAYMALKERGEQLEKERKYSNAVLIFKQAVEYAKSLTNTVLNSQLTTTTTSKGLPVTILASTSAKVNTATAISLDFTSISSFTIKYGGDKNISTERELENIRREAESERNLALAYVSQAEHEVNVRERRQQLSNAVNSAYAAQNALQRWTLKFKSPNNNNNNNSGTLIDVASSLVVAATALLRLGQPKKAALLIEPLIEDKVNSASIRPPLWSNVLLPLTNPPTLSDIVERVETLRVKIMTYNIHAQCLSKFDGERGFREARRAQEFLQKVKEWAVLPSLPIKSENSSENNNNNNNTSTLQILKEECTAAKYASYQSLREVNTTLPILTITCGDSLALLGKWEDALQEYSNALAMYAGGYSDDGILDNPKEREREHNNYRMGESLVLAKLAEVYIALEKPKTAIHYYGQVLEYAAEVKDALLQYNARIHLARLYTTTGETVKAGEHWAKVSALAKEYEDQEISRETTRNIVAAQRATGMYMDVITTAKELDLLASAAEGVDAAADKRFALEALADAHLQLGQYKECIKALDEREKVQDKCGQRKGVLFSMRARALLADGAVQEAIKVLTIWVNEARQLCNWIEVGNANAVLAQAYATTRQIFKAKRHHHLALSAFSDIPEMNQECCQSALESARWLVHYFYLNDEEVVLGDGDFDNMGRLSQGKASPVSPQHNPQHQQQHQQKKSSHTGSSSKNNSNENEDMDEYQVRNDSGDLNVLMQEEEKRFKKRQETSSTNTTTKDSSPDIEGNIDNLEDGKEILSNCSMFGMNMASLLDDEKNSSEISNTHNNNYSHSNSSSSSSSSSKSTSSGSDNTEKEKKNISSKRQKDDNTSSIDRPKSPSTPTSVNLITSTIPNSRSGSTSLANVSLCKYPAALEGEIVTAPQLLPIEEEEDDDDDDEEEESYSSNICTKVQTICFRRALETIETAAQLSLMPLKMRQRLIPRNPADTIDLALLSFPYCTFVFYFAEFATQFSVVIRPAGRSFFLKRSVQAYSLKEYHSKKQIASVIPVSGGGTGTGTTRQTGVNNSESPSQQSTGNLEKHVSVIASSLSSMARKSRTSSVEISQVVPDPSAEWIAINDDLIQDLRDLHADLWAPVRDSLRMAHCFDEEVECLILVLDPALLHIPFPALQDSGLDADPLGKKFTIVVTPTIAQFMQGMRREKTPSLLQAPKQERCVFLPENKTTSTNTNNINAIAASSLSSSTHINSRRLSVATTRSTAATEDARHNNISNIPTGTTTTTTTTGGGGGIIATANECFANATHPWTLFSGCTRKEMISTFASSHCRALMILCDPVEQMFKVADGMVRLSDLLRGHICLPDSLDLVVVTCDLATQTSTEEPGVAARLCLQHGCRRVLRLDLFSGTSITDEHQHLLGIYMEKLALVLEWNLRYPYAMALRLTQEEAQRRCYSPDVRYSLTLIGAA